MQLVISIGNFYLKSSWGGLKQHSVKRKTARVESRTLTGSHAAFVDWSRKPLDLPCIIYRVVFAFTFLRDRAALKATGNGDAAALPQPLKQNERGRHPGDNFNILYGALFIYLFIYSLTLVKVMEPMEPLILKKKKKKVPASQQAVNVSGIPWTHRVF